MNYNSTTHMTIKEVRAALAARSEFRLLDISGGNFYGYDWAIVRRDEPKHYLLKLSLKRALVAVTIGGQGAAEE